MLSGAENNAELEISRARPLLEEGGGSIFLLSTITSRTSFPRCSASVASSTPPLGLLLLLCHRHDIDTDAVKAQALEHLLGVAVDVQLAALRVLRKVQRRDLGHVLVFALSLFFLQLEGNATYGPALDALHQMGGVAGDLEGGGMTG
jgi:hypothetical protein